MTSTIIEALNRSGWNLKRHAGDVGIEIETETKSSYTPPAMTFWNHHVDGSLRDFGIEYVLKAPTSNGQQTREALEEWDTKVAKKFKLVEKSFSTSVHVHINFLNNTWRELVNFLTVYYLVENLLIRYSGPDRLSNLFCLPICDAEGELEGVLRIVQGVGKLNYKSINLSPDSYKYSALNVCNLATLGTLEVRSMRGVTDIKDIADWVGILMSIKAFACQPGMTPMGIIEMFDKIGPEIVYPIFGDYVGLIDVPEKHDLMLKNLYYCSKIATASKFDNENWGFPKPKKIFREKLIGQLDVISQDLFKRSYKELLAAQRIVVDERLSRNMNLQNDNVIFELGDD